jgi:hypothetical protein
LGVRISCQKWSCKHYWQTNFNTNLILLLQRNL